MFPKEEKICPNCGCEIVVEEVDEEIPKEQKEFIIKGKKNAPQMPTLDINWHIEKGHTKFETFKILKSKWITFLCKFDIPLKDFEYHERKGNFKQRFNKHLFKLYLEILRSILKDGKHVKYESYCEKILTETKNKKYYEI